MKNEQMVRVTTGTYKGFASITMESEHISLTTVPDIGGKLVSIVYKPTGREWMLDSGHRALRQPEYGSSFSEWDMSGWDECFPTINACPSMIDKDITLPDHGEIWAIPWDYTIVANTIFCSVRSPRLHYLFTRRISFPSTDRIRIDYRVDNLSDQPMPFLWVPHPQFAIIEPTRVLLPDYMDKMMCVYEGLTLKREESYTWDDVSLLAPGVTGDGRKFYYEGQVPAGWSGLYGEESGNYLIMSVPRDKVPYLGVWMDEGKFNDRVTCALEPSIGYYDSLDMAEGNGTARHIPAKASFAWYLELSIGAGDWRHRINKFSK
ncbi:hypothetical protein GCM10008018_42380 [Paenibacillus marchantiophytorum]|uniref:DUF5107 domain-containing protein n=1 Tax=Paenibacillus marchantiophytorum TaxID=1619310 RepID=A0ABQ1EYR9_9BACL|nr:hypothetical protein [Paenibacillus marchantiophytorum]GFZ91606.1 hypothetical protein GCM10008018_42380 [Paenibacillus marchantiophytorum]